MIIVEDIRIPNSKQCECIGTVALAKEFKCCVFELHRSSEGTVHGLLTVSLRSVVQWNSRSFVIRLPGQGLDLFNQILSSYATSKRLEGYRELINTSVLPCGVQADLQNAQKSAQESWSQQRSRQIEVEQKCNTSIKDLTKYFHLPINVAGKAIGICPTVLKKICRKHGLQRWPHRKLRSIDRLLEKLQSSANEVKTPSVFCMHAQNVTHQVQMLKLERAQLCFEPRPGMNIERE